MIGSLVTQDSGSMTFTPWQSADELNSDFIHGHPTGLKTYPGRRTLQLRLNPEEPSCGRFTSHLPRSYLDELSLSQTEGHPNPDFSHPAVYGSAATTQILEVYQCSECLSSLPYLSCHHQCFCNKDDDGFFESNDIMMDFVSCLGASNQFLRVIIRSAPAPTSLPRRKPLSCPPFHPLEPVMVTPKRHGPGCRA